MPNQLNEGFKWIEAARPKPARSRSSTPDSYLTLLKNNPGQTAVIASYGTKTSAAGTASTIRLNRRKGFESGNWDSWEQESITHPGRWDVIVAFLGDVAPRRS